MDHIGTSPNKFMATFWFVFAVFVTIGSIPVLWSPAKLSIIGLLMLACVFLLMGLQRTEKYRFEDSKFKKTIRTLGFTAAIISAITIPLNIVLI